MNAVRPAVIGVVATVLLGASGGRAIAQTADDVIDLRGIYKGSQLDGEQAALRGLSAEEVKLPRPKRTPMGRFPEIARATGHTGVVLLECRIETNGRTDDCKVTHSAGDLVDQAALDTVKEWRYTPLKLRGEPRPALLLVALGGAGFSMSGRTADPSGDVVEELRYKGREYDARDP